MSSGVVSIYTKEQIAEAMQVTVRTVERLMEKGDLAYSLVGSRPRITSQQLADYLARTERPARSEAANTRRKKAA